jgi:predicted signal transduction protein with EAL and GGDEF domain
VCVGCREEVELPFEFKMAFQPIVDIVAQKVWGYEALVRGVNGESALSILNQVNEDIRYRFDQASRVMAIETAGALFVGRDLRLSVIRPAMLALTHF